MSSTDPRDKWTATDWAVAHAYFLMKACVPPGPRYIAFYRHCETHRQVSLTRVEKTIRDILKYRNEQWTQQHDCITQKIVGLWSTVQRINS